MNKNIIEPPRGMQVGGMFEWATGNARSVLGVDIGRRRDPSAIAVVEERRVKTGWDAANWAEVFGIKTVVRYVERMPLGTSYTKVVERIKTVKEMLVETPPIAVVMDATGVGDAVVEMAHRAEIGCRLAPVTITSGDEVTESDGWWKVPKRELVANLQVMLEERKLRIAGGMAEVSTLVREMQEMRVRVGPSGREQYAARGKGEHDDLVMAVALAAWWLERRRLSGRRVGEQGRPLF